MKKALFWMLLILLITTLPVIACAASLKSFAVSVTNVEDGALQPSATVNWYKQGDVYYLFLPGGTDWNTLRVWFEGKQDEISVNGQTLKNGNRLTSVTSEGDYKVVCGKSEYTIRIMQGSSISACFISTDSGYLNYIHKNKNNKEGGHFLLLRADGNSDYDGTLAHIKLRGNTSTTLSKKNYGLKLEKGADLGDMGKAKRWVLLGSYRDHAQLRNQIVYNMAEYAGLRYTPEVMPVDVYFNQDYYGTYLLTEKIEVNDERVNIADLKAANEAVNDKPLEEYKKIGSYNVKKGKYKAYALENDPEDITGGYIIEYENYQPRYSSESSAYVTTRGKVLLAKAPEILSQAEAEYIFSFMQGYENAIFSEDGIDSSTGKRYDEFVDFDSLVLKYMLEEVSMNCDGNASSQYYVKPSDSESKVAYAGPAWDYDTTFGGWATKRKASLLNPECFLHNSVDGSKYWWPRLYQKTEFYDAICEKWKTVYSHALSILLGQEKDEAKKLLSIDEYAAAIAKSADMNFVRWPIAKTSHKSSGNIADTGSTFAENVEYLKEFVARRYTFLADEWGK